MSDGAAETDSRSRLEHHELGSLYPQPKSYEQLERERLARKKLFRAKQPKMSPLQISYRLTVLIMAVYIVANNASIFMLFGVFAGVFLLVLACLILFGMSYMLFGAVKAEFERRGRGFVFAASTLMATC